MAANSTNDVPQEELEEVVDALDKESLTWRNMPQSPLARMVYFLGDGSLRNKSGRILFQMFVANNNFVDTPSRELDKFKSLQIRFPWMRKSARIAYAAVVRKYQASPREHWIISQVFHFLYDLPKEFIYSEIVRLWTLAFSVSKDNGTAWDEVDMKDLIDFMTWTITRMVAKILTDPYSYYTRLAMDMWNVQAENSEISSSLTFATTMRLMPFNMRAIYPDGTNSSFQSILENGPRWDYIAAHVLYPTVFTDVPEPDTIRDIAHAIRTALSGGASLQQVQQIYPYTNNPTRAALMADIARAALSVGRMDIAEAYGFGPSFLAYIDTAPSYARHKLSGSVYSGWHVYDLLDDVPTKDHIVFLRALGFDSQQAQEIITAHDGYLSE